MLLAEATSQPSLEQRSSWELFLYPCSQPLPDGLDAARSISLREDSASSCLPCS